MSGTSGYETELAKLSTYADKKLNNVFRLMLISLFNETPEDPIDHMICFLQNYQDEHKYTNRNTDSSAMPVMSVSLPEGSGKMPNRGRRRDGVSAESVSPVDMMAPTRVINKSDPEREEIRSAVASNILFQNLDEEQMNIIIDAMERKEYQTGDWIIRQGEEGNDFYVLSSGKAETFITIAGEQKMVKIYNHGESFGELALMYNKPRAASIQAAEPTVCWVMDRFTFRKVLMTSTADKRTKYEDFLSKVPVLATLDQYERAKVADALIEKTFYPEQNIITAGETDTFFYILLEGQAIATKVLKGEDGPVTVMTYRPGDYFGELALLSAAPRAANVIATGPCKVVYLDRDSFERLLGPCQEVLLRDKEKYAAVEARLKSIAPSSPKNDRSESESQEKDD